MYTQGVPTFMNFNTNTGTYKAEFTLDTSIDASTQIYLNKEYYYPHGVYVDLYADDVKLEESQVVIDHTNI